MIWLDIDFIRFSVLRQKLHPHFQRMISLVEVETKYPDSECFRILARGMNATQTGVPGDETER